MIKKLRTTLTMREAIMYRLFQNLKNGNLHIPVFDFMGDIYCEELKKGGFVSHECSARLSEIRTDNRKLLDVKRQKAKYTSSYFFSYKLHDHFTYDMIADTSLRDFYQSLQLTYNPKPKPVVLNCPHGLPQFVECPACSKV